jgi:RHS repeat-associated protein
VDTCACAQSTYWASVGGVDCSVLPTMYFYHPDYLGSVEFVTDMSGDPYQFFLNTIWGENLQNQLAFNTTAFSSRFRFNGKEWDEETGNFYYGARYYDPKISVWLSVDPLAAKFNNLSPYHFSVNNPINVFDHDGRDTTHANKQTQQRVNDAYHSTLKRIERLEKKIDKGMEDFLNGDMSDRKEGKYMDMLQEYRELSDIKRDFERIFDENTPCVKYEINDDKVGEGNSGLTVFKKGETITVYLSSGHPNSYYNQSVVIHENVHVNQIYSGVSHRSHNSELKAYQRQAIFEPGYVERFIQMQKSTGLWEAIQTSYWDYPVY